MQNTWFWKILSTAALTIGIIGSTWCNQWSPEDQALYTVGNIKTQTIKRRYGDRCIAILSAEEESLRAISQATHISPIQSSELREKVRVYTLWAIKVEIERTEHNPRQQCDIFAKKGPLNPPIKEVILWSKSLTDEDKKGLLWRSLKKKY